MNKDNPQRIEITAQEMGLSSSGLKGNSLKPDYPSWLPC